jgi:glycosyltransferase involved in cell wall biosynthesis
VTTARQSFLFVITAYNAGPFLGALASSLAAQCYTDWKAVFIDDCSTDHTLDTLRALLATHALADRFQIVENPERRFKAQNVYLTLKGHGQPDDVVVMLDSDDHLAADDVLDRLAREYNQGWEIVWSNWRGSDGSHGTSRHLNPFVSPRRQPLVSSHLFSFKRRLFGAVTESDLQDEEGRWLTAGCDVAIAWPLLDQTIKRKHIEDVLYVYNRTNPLSHDKLEGSVRPLVSASQDRTSAILRRRPGKELHIDQQFLLTHLYELLQAATLSDRVATRHQIAAAMASAKKGPAADPGSRRGAT